ncbi:hypothetical protein CARUB_v10015148mg, partial [Capsella rubella]
GEPAVGVLKCNVHCSWINELCFSGGAWLLRNHDGEAMCHAWDAFLPHQNRISAELSCIYWCLKSLKDLHITSCEVWSDCHAALSALANPVAWPKYQSILDNFAGCLQSMEVISFYVSSPKENVVTRDIAKSVTREGRLTSYLSLGGPAWLHEKIERD